MYLSSINGQHISYTEKEQSMGVRNVSTFFSVSSSSICLSVCQFAVFSFLDESLLVIKQMLHMSVSLSVYWVSLLETRLAI